MGGQYTKSGCFILLQIEAKVFLAKFIQSFKMIPGPGMTDEIEEVATLRPLGGVPVKLISADYD